MRKKTNLLMMTLITMITSLVFSSCSKDDESTDLTENYYFQLTDVNTNCVDANGNSVASSLMEEWIIAADADPLRGISLGKYSRDNAIKSFDLTIEDLRSRYQELYAGKNILPEGGYIIYKFALKTQSGSVVTHASIRVTNTGVTSY